MKEGGKRGNKREKERKEGGKERKGKRVRFCNYYTCFSLFVADSHLPATYSGTVFLHILDKYVDQYQVVSSCQFMQLKWNLLTAAALPCEKIPTISEISNENYQEQW